MKKILLVGDSIRMSYCEKVKSLFDGRAEVFYPAENCRYARFTLWGIQAWVGLAGEPDIIHWNNGIWDASRNLSIENEHFEPIDTYKETLRRCIREFRFRAPKARIIFALTTAVGNNKESLNNEDVDLYNEAAKSVMAEAGIEIDDLNALIKTNIPQYISSDNVHLTPAGVDVCSAAVVKAIEKYL